MGIVKSNSLSVLLFDGGTESTRSTPYPVYSDLSDSQEYYLVSSNGTDIEGLYFGNNESIIGIDTILPGGSVVVNPFIEENASNESENINYLLYSTSSSIEFSNTINRTRYKTTEGSSDEIISLSQGNWSISSESLLTNDNDHAEAILDKLNSQSYCIVVFKYGENRHFIGQAIAESGSITSGVNDIATFSVTFRGYGPLYNASESLLDSAGGTNEYPLVIEGIPFHWFRRESSTTPIGPTGAYGQTFVGIATGYDPAQDWNVGIGNFIDVTLGNDDPQDFFTSPGPFYSFQNVDVTSNISATEFANAVNAAVSYINVGGITTLINQGGRADSHYGGYSVTTGPNEYTTNIYKTTSDLDPTYVDSTSLFVQPWLDLGAWNDGYQVRWIPSYCALVVDDGTGNNNYVYVTGNPSLDEAKVIALAPSFNGSGIRQVDFLPFSDYSSVYSSKSLDTPGELVFAYLGKNPSSYTLEERNEFSSSIFGLYVNFVPVLYNSAGEVVHKYDGSDGDPNYIYPLFYRNSAKFTGTGLTDWAAMHNTYDNIEPFGNLGVYFPGYRVTNSTGSPANYGYASFFANGLPSGNWDGVMKIRNIITDTGSPDVSSDLGFEKWIADPSGSGCNLRVRRYQKVKEIRLYVDETQGYDTYQDPTQTDPSRTDYVLLHQGTTSYTGAVSFANSDYNYTRPVNDDTSTREITINFNDFTIFDNSNNVVNIAHATFVQIVYNFYYKVNVSLTDSSGTVDPLPAQGSLVSMSTYGTEIPLTLPINLP